MNIGEKESVAPEKLYVGMYDRDRLMLNNIVPGIRGFSSNPVKDACASPSNSLPILSPTKPHACMALSWSCTGGLPCGSSAS